MFRVYLFGSMVGLLFLCTNAQSFKPIFLEIPKITYHDQQNILVLNAIEEYDQVINDSIGKNTVLFNFLVEEKDQSTQKSEAFIKLLKDSLSSLKSSWKVYFKIQPIRGNVYLNAGEAKVSMVHLNAMVYSKDKTLLKNLFGKGKYSKIDTTSNRMKKFNHEFIPFYDVTEEVEGVTFNKDLFVFRNKKFGRGYACIPNEDKDIASMLTLIYKKK